MVGGSLHQARLKVTQAPTAKPPPNPFVRAQFLMSAAEGHQLPRDDAPEVAFAGRSNAGKSSALNALCGLRQLARVSKTPGRTQLINLFDLPGEPFNSARLVDLPGYGYAKVPEPMRQHWRRLVGGYVGNRPNLRGVVVVMDIRHPLTDIDRQMLEWAQAHQRSVHILLTKADKLAFGVAKQTLLKVQAELKNQASVQLFSASAKQGVDEAREAVTRLFGIDAASGT
jgi:GTP-binding protein